VNSLRRNTIRLSCAGIAAAGIDFLYRVIVSRQLGAGTVGLYALIMPVYAICNAIIASGLPVAVMRLVAPYKEHPAERRRIVRAASLLILGAAAVIALLIVLFREELATFLRIDGQGRSLLVLALLVLVTGFDNLFYSYFYAVDEIAVPSFAQVLEQLLRLAVLFVLLPFIAKLNDSYAVVAWLLFITVLGEVFGALYLFLHYRKGMRGYIKNGDGRPIAAPTGSLLKISAPITLTRIVSTAIVSVCTTLVPFRLTAWGMAQADAVALFGVLAGMVLPLVMLPNMLLRALSVLIVPTLSENSAKQRHRDTAAKIKKTLRVTALVVFPTAALFIALSKPLGNLLFKNADAGLYIAPMTAAMVFMCFSQMLTSILHGLGRQNMASFYQIVCGLVQVALVYFLVGILGAQGVVWSYILPGVMLCVLLLFELRKAQYIGLIQPPEST